MLLPEPGCAPNILAARTSRAAGERAAILAGSGPRSRTPRLSLLGLLGVDPQPGAVRGSRAPIPDYARTSGGRPPGSSGIGHALMSPYAQTCPCPSGRLEHRSAEPRVGGQSPVSAVTSPGSQGRGTPRVVTESVGTDSPPARYGYPCPQFTVPRVWWDSTTTTDPCASICIASLFPRGGSYRRPCRSEVC